MFSVRVTLFIVAPSGMALATSKVKSVLLADPLPVFPTKRCWPDPLLAKLLEAWYKVLSLLGPKFTVVAPSSSCGSSVGGTGVLVASGVARGSAVAVAGGVVAVGAAVAVGAGVSVGLDVAAGIVVAAGGVVGVGAGANVAAGSNVAVASAVEAGTGVAEVPQAAANNTTTIAASGAIILVPIACPVRKRLI